MTLTCAPRHLQLLQNMVDFGMDPQAAIDAPRFCIADGRADGVVSLEAGVSPQVAAELAAMGHDIKYPAAGLDEGLLSFSLPHSRLYGESPYVKHINVVNDSVPSYIHRPRCRRTRPSAARRSS